MFTVSPGTTVEGNTSNTSGSVAGAGVMVVATVRRLSCVCAVSVAGAGAARKVVAFDEMLNDTLACPSGTIKDAGAGTSVSLLLVKLTGVPPGGAGAINVTVPVALSPGAGFAGDIVNDASDRAGLARKYRPSSCTNVGLL